MIGIVGGGISGLFVLHFLSEAGLDALLFESGAQPGGVLQSRKLEGPNGPVVVDLGPQRVRLTPGLAEIVDRVGLRPSVLEAPRGIPFTIYHEGSLHPAPLTPRDAAATRLISRRGKLRALADLITPGPRDDESVAASLRRKLGPEIYERLAGPILGGLYGSDPAQMESRHTLVPILARAGGSRSLLLTLLRISRTEGLPAITFRGGMGALSEALFDRHRDRIRLGSPVLALHNHGSEGFEVVTQEAVTPVRSVVLTLPAPPASPLLREVAPEAAETLGRLRYNPLAVVPLVVDASAAIPQVGTGFKMTLESRMATRGVTSHDALFHRPGLFSSFLGGMGQEAFVDRPDDEILATAREEFEAVTGARATPLLVHRTWMPAWDRSWQGIEALRLPEGLHLCAAYAARPGIPGRLEDARRVARLLTRR